MRQSLCIIRYTGVLDILDFDDLEENHSDRISSYIIQMLFQIRSLWVIEAAVQLSSLSASSWLQLIDGFWWKYITTIKTIDIIYDIIWYVTILIHTYIYIHILIGGLEHVLWLSIQSGMSSSQLTNSYFSERLKPPTSIYIYTYIYIYIMADISNYPTTARGEQQKPRHGWHGEFSQCRVVSGRRDLWRPGRVHALLHHSHMARTAAETACLLPRLFGKEIVFELSKVNWFDII